MQVLYRGQDLPKRPPNTPKPGETFKKPDFVRDMLLFPVPFPDGRQLGRLTAAETEFGNGRHTGNVAGERGTVGKANLLHGRVVGGHAACSPEKEALVMKAGAAFGLVVLAGAITAAIC